MTGLRIAIVAPENSLARVGGIGDHTHHLASSLGQEADVQIVGVPASPDGRHVLAGCLAWERFDRVLFQYEPWHWARGGLIPGFHRWLKSSKAVDPSPAIGLLLHEVDIYPRVRAGDVALSWLRQRQLYRASRLVDFVVGPVEQWRSMVAPSTPFHVAPVGSNLTGSTGDTGGGTNQPAAGQPNVAAGAFTLALFGRVHDASLTAARAIIDSWPHETHDLTIRHYGAAASVPESIGSTQVERQGILPNDALVDQLSQSDALLACFPDGASLRRSSLLAGLALGLPCLTNRGVWTNSVLSEQDGISLAFVDKEEIGTRVIRNLVFDKENRARMSQAARSFYRDSCSWDVGVRVIREALEPSLPRLEAREASLRNPHRLTSC